MAKSTAGLPLTRAWVNVGPPLGDSAVSNMLVNGTLPLLLEALKSGAVGEKPVKAAAVAISPRLKTL